MKTLWSKQNRAAKLGGLRKKITAYEFSQVAKFLQPVHCDIYFFLETNKFFFFENFFFNINNNNKNKRKEKGKSTATVWLQKFHRL